MIKVSVLYPNNEGSSFNMDYDLNSHFPMRKDRLGDACKGAAVEAGGGGGPTFKPWAVVSRDVLLPPASRPDPIERAIVDRLGGFL